MKITDYGLWFGKYGYITRFKKPQNCCEIYFNGFKVGSRRRIVSLSNREVDELCFSVDIEFLARIGFRIKPNCPGEIMHDDWWYFPVGYVPTESDFEELL